MSPFSIRVCYVRVPGLLDMESADDYMFNSFATSWFELRPELNITWIKSHAMGGLVDLATLAYDGCIGSIQRNESDVGMTASENTDYGPHVTLWNIMFFDQTNIATAYNKDNETESRTTGVLNFVSSYTASQWLITLLLMMLILLVFVTVIKMRATNFAHYRTLVQRTVSILLSCFLRHHSSSACSRRTSLTQYLYTLMTLLGFFTGLFLTSMIKTEVVVMKIPATYNSYQDLVDHDVTPLWVSEMDDQRFFRLADKGSVEHKIWEQAVSRGVNKSVIYANQMISGSLDTALPILMSIAERKAVGLTNRHFTKIAISNVCAFMRSNGIYPNVNTFTIVDANAATILRVQIGSVFTASSTRDHVRKGMGRKFEMMTFEANILKTYSFFLASNVGNVAKVQECMSNLIILPNHAIVPISLHHYQYLILIVAALILLSCRVWLTEQWKCK